MKTHRETAKIFPTESGRERERVIYFRIEGLHSRKGMQNGRLITRVSTLHRASLVEQPSFQIFCRLESILSTNRSKRLDRNILQGRVTRNKIILEFISRNFIRDIHNIVFLILCKELIQF